MTLTHQTCQPSWGAADVDDAVNYYQRGAPSLEAELVQASNRAGWAYHRGDTLGRDTVERLTRDSRYRKTMREYLNNLRQERRWNR